MSAMRSESAVSAYEGGPRGYGARARGRLVELWEDKARLRRVAMIGGVALVLAIALILWLTGGRYVGTDDSYVHAAQLMVSTDVSGLVQDVDVREGQHVKKGDVLFRLDPRPFNIAVENAKASVAQAALDLQSAKASYRSALAQIAAQRAQVQLAQTTYDRYAALAREHAIAPTTVDQARGTMETAKATLVSLQQTADTLLAKLKGNPDLPVEQYPDYQQALATLAEDERQLDHATVRAPFSGIVTEVDSLQPGTLVISALSAFTTTSAVGLVSDTDIWVDANMKETDLTHVRNGDPVKITVDTYPGCTWNGTVDAVSAASDSAFSALPSENSGGNWVKVVQRIPTRITLGKSDCKVQLRTGMSAYVEIDTHHRRWYRLLFGH